MYKTLAAYTSAKFLPPKILQFLRRRTPESVQLGFRLKYLGVLKIFCIVDAQCPTLEVLI